MSCMTWSWNWWRLRNKRNVDEDENLSPTSEDNHPAPSSSASGSNESTSFTFSELETATKDFSVMIGKGGFGSVYKGRLHDGQEIAVKRLKPDSQQGHQEFEVEVSMLKKLHHPNLVKLIGYCDEDHHRLLVYEYMSNGSLGHHLHGNREGCLLNWNTRMRIALGVARGLRYLHCLEHPVIYRDMKSANILLDKEFNPRLSDFGLAKLGPTGDQTHIFAPVMGTFGYLSADYAMSGELSTKLDVYSFGALLLELVSGRSALDQSKPRGQENIVLWSRPLIRDRKYFRLMDPRLKGEYPRKDADFLIKDVIADMIVDNPQDRPTMKKVVKLLKRLYAESSASSSSTAP